MSDVLQSTIDFIHVANGYFYPISLIGLREQ